MLRICRNVTRLVHAFCGCNHLLPGILFPPGALECMHGNFHFMVLGVPGCAHVCVQGILYLVVIVFPVCMCESVQGFFHLAGIVF